MTFSDFRSHTNPLFIELKLLKVVRDIIKSQQLKLVYEFIKNDFPTDLQNLFTLSSDIHKHNLNSVYKQLLHIPRIFTVTYGNKSIKFHCAKLWNDTFKNNGIVIDNDVNKNICVNQIHNINQFKRILKKHFIYKYSME